MSLLRNPALSAGCVMSAIVTTVVMATLVVGPFYLSGALALGAAQVGLVMSAGPVVAALTSLPAGRSVDRLGAYRVTIAGLFAMAAGTASLAALPTTFGIPGYIAPLVLITAGYALFQAANNTAVMINIRSDQRGVVSGLLNLSRNLGLITGASAMGAIFALAANLVDTTAASPEAVARGMRMTFVVAVTLVVFAFVIAVAGRIFAARHSLARRGSIE
jgi:MFS family permease